MSKTNEDYASDAMAEYRGMLDWFDRSAKEKDFARMEMILNYFKGSEHLEDTYLSLHARYDDLKEKELEERWLREEQSI